MVSSKGCDRVLDLAPEPVLDPNPDDDFEPDDYDHSQSKRKTKQVLYTYV